MYINQISVHHVHDMWMEKDSDNLERSLINGAHMHTRAELVKEYICHVYLECMGIMSCSTALSSIMWIWLFVSLDHSKPQVVVIVINIVCGQHTRRQPGGPAPIGLWGEVQQQL